MPTIEENLTYWKRYDWKDRGREWTQGYGGMDNAWEHAILPRVGAFLPAGHVLELAPGYGAWTDYLKPMSREMTLVDLTPNCIEHCRLRYGKKRMHYYVNDGYSLSMLEDNSIDFVFSVHSLVHAEHDVMQSYVHQLGRIMKPGAVGFIHHSNLGEYAGTMDSWEPGEDHWRGKDMTGEKFRRDCADAGLVCIYQEIIPWGGKNDKFIDAYSLFARPRPGQRLHQCVERNAAYWSHVWKRIEIAKRYAWPE